MFMLQVNTGMAQEPSKSGIVQYLDRLEAIGGLEYELDHVPEGGRRTLMGLIAVWAAATIVPSAFLFGGSLAEGLSTWQFIITFEIGAFLAFIVAILVGFIAQDLGLTFHTLSRFFFGKRGSIIPSGIQVITRIGWGAVSLAFAASFVFNLFDMELFIVAVLVLAIPYVISALIGFTALKWVSYVTIPVFLIVFGWGLFGVIGFEFMGGMLGEQIPLTQAIGLSAAFWIAGALVAGDWLRYGRDQKDILISTAVALLGFNFISVGLGYFSAVGAGEANIAQAMVGAGIILPATLALVLITWTTVDNWLYSGSLGLSNIVEIRKIYSVVILGAVMIAISGFRFHELIIPWISLLGVFLPPLFGPLFVEYYVLDHKFDTIDMQQIPYAFNWVAVGAWAIGSGVGWFTPDVYIVPAVAAIVSIVAYYVLYIALEDTALYPIDEKVSGAAQSAAAAGD